eukprot:3846660-Prymnesium_polylepis.2
MVSHDGVASLCVGFWFRARPADNMRNRPTCQGGWRVHADAAPPPIQAWATRRTRIRWRT